MTGAELDSGTGAAFTISGSTPGEGLITSRWRSTCRLYQVSLIMTDRPSLGFRWI
jgi:hypothetical protein